MAALDHTYTDPHTMDLIARTHIMEKVELRMRIEKLEAALRRSETLLTALAMGFAKNVTVDLVCDERHLTAVLNETRAALSGA